MRPVKRRLVLYKNTLYEDVGLSPGKPHLISPSKYYTIEPHFGKDLGDFEPISGIIPITLWWLSKYGIIVSLCLNALALLISILK